MLAAADILPISDNSAIGALLEACRLPAADAVASESMLFFGISQQGQLQALVGLELGNGCALLRSLAVAPALRSQGLGRLLLQHAEQHARQLGIGTLYLLTTDASGVRVARHAATANGPALGCVMPGLQPASAARHSRCQVPAPPVLAIAPAG
jgi:GNAT superfamily N-acetyltransferase